MSRNNNKASRYVVENRDKGPWEFEYYAVTQEADEKNGIPEVKEKRTFLLGDPADRGRMTDDGVEVYQPRQEIDASEWALVLEQHGAAIENLQAADKLTVHRL